MDHLLFLITLGQSIKEIRKEQGLSQEALAKKAEIAQSTLVYIESGMKAINMHTLLKICDSLSITTLDLAIIVDKSLSQKENRLNSYDLV